MSHTSGQTSSAGNRPPRRTLAGRATVLGVGLFTGTPSRLTIAPTDPAAQHAGGGIWFQRSDLPAKPRIRAIVANVAPERRRTLLTSRPPDAPPVDVHTVEHVLSALAGLGITDAVLELEGLEIPIVDGSATPFADAIRSAGVRELDPSAHEPLAPIVITQTLVVSDKGAEIVATPSDQPGCEMTYELDYGDAAPLPRQSASLRIGADGVVCGYAEQVASARTFCLVDEAIAMRKMGLFQSFEPKDLLVIGPAGPVDNAYRFDNEPARHKLLDMLGDLSLAGRPIQGTLVAKRSGHALNHQMAGVLANLTT